MMALFKSNFWGEKNAGFDVLYHNMKHGQIATKELAEFVRERAAVEETYSKSMSKLAKMASNGSQLGTFAPMWDVFRVSSDKLALCHLELMRKMNDLIRDINKYSEEQVKVHRKTKEEVVGTLEAVQALQVQSTQLQKSREGYHTRCIELDRMRKEGVPQKELEKAEHKSKKSAEVLTCSIEKYNRVGGDFEQKMSESAQKFQVLEETHLSQMKQLIRAYSHSIEDTHVQVGQVHEEFKQNVENIGIENLIQKFTEVKGTGKERPGSVGFEDFLPSFGADTGKKSRGKAFRIPGLGKRDKEPDSTESAIAEAPNSMLEVDEEGFVIRSEVSQNGDVEDKENNFYSSDSDADEEEPKKFHIQIRPVGTSGRSNSAANELELKATVGALTLPPNRGVSVKRHFSRNSSTLGYSEGGAVGDQEDLHRSTSSPDNSRSSCTASGSDVLFGPPLELAFKSSRFADREQLTSGFGVSEYAAFSSDSSSPENVEDSGLDSPSHQPLGPSPEPSGWAAWPVTSAPESCAEQGIMGRPSDPFLTAFRDPSPGRPVHLPNEKSVWMGGPCSPLGLPDVDPASFIFPTFPTRLLAPANAEVPVWSCKHVSREDPFLAAFPQETLPPPPPEVWVPPQPHQSRELRGMDTQGDPFSVSLGKEIKTLPPPSSTSSSNKDRNRKRDRSVPPPLESPVDDPFAITIIGSPTHQSSLAATAAPGNSSHRPNPAPHPGPHPAPNPTQAKKEAQPWSSQHNPFSCGPRAQAAGPEACRMKQRSCEEKPRRNGPPLTRHSGPQEDLCFSTDKDQNCLEINSQPDCNINKGSQNSFRQDSEELLVAAPTRLNHGRRMANRLNGSERSRSVCSSPLPDPSPTLTSSSSSSSPSEWGVQTRAPSPARVGLSRGPSPIPLSTQEAWPVATAITEYINAFFKGGEHNRCLVKITGDLTMSFPAGITRLFTANPNAPVLSFRLLNISRMDHFLPNQKLLYSDPSQTDPDSRDFWFNMPALTFHLQKEAELSPQASYHNVGLLKYQVSSQDPARAPLLLSAECQRSGTVTRVSLDYHCCPATAPAAQLTAVQVLLPLDHAAADVQCQPPASWNAEERRLLWKLPNLSPTNHSKGSGTLCASWQQCTETSRGPPPSLAVQFVGSGASLSGVDVELLGKQYRMSLVKKRFATGKYMAGCSL
ncbi:f-BAR domain only protein 1 isoform X1 [Denticeps clupeoides]|uniref:f-BAR domain only protein 1 isoform X1 n=2 Tax=Denticeps clupeoides TaxID=299321 RepID=UPI0010A3F1C5|nr:F-BAR domain only protein 1-like isoform X1 [Denticeps clupeoides]